MTAQGATCNGTGEAPTAEFAAEKAAAARKAPAERDGENVGGPFVIVNGDSDGLSDRGSDLGKALDEDSPSEEDEELGSNAAPDAPVGGDHRATAGEIGASSVVPDTKFADGHDHAPSEEPEGGAIEGKGEPIANLVTADVAQQEPAGGKQGWADASLATGSDRAITGAPGADSDAPAVDFEINGKEGKDEDSATTDVTELVVEETSSAEQKISNAAMETRAHDGAPTKTESGSVGIEPEVHVHYNREKKIAASEVEPTVHNTCGPDMLMVNEHHSGETKPDSFEVSVDTRSHDAEIKSEKNATKLVDLVEQSDVCGEKDVACALQLNGHTHVGVSSDSNASSSEVHAKETEAQESYQQEEGEPIRGAKTDIVEIAGKDLTDRVEESTEEKVDADVHSCVKVSTGETESLTEKVEGEATCILNEVEEKMDNDGEGESCDDLTADVVSNEEVKLPAEEGINEDVPIVGDLEAAPQDTNQEIIQDDGLVKDGETYPSVETSQENNSQVGIAQVDETAAELDSKVDSRIEVSIAASLLSQQNCDSAVETVNNKQLGASDVDQLNEIENDVEKSEAMQEVETDICDAVPLQAAAASSVFTSHNEPQPTDLVDGGSVKDSSPLSTELESCGHAPTEENRFQETSDTTVGQHVYGASLEHKSTMVGKAELCSVSGYESQEKPCDSTVDQGEPVTLSADELVAADVAEPSSATDYESAGIDKVMDISKKDDSSDIAGDKLNEGQSETCNASTACDAAEDSASKSLEALEPSLADRAVLAECKDDDKHGHNEEANIAENSSQLHVDLDRNNMGDAHVVKPQAIYIIKVPRFTVEDHWAKQQDAHAHLDKLTQERDAINVCVQKQKFVYDQYKQKLDAARRDEREARAAHGDKKNDLNSLRSVIGILNQANSIEEIEEMIVTKEKIMQHETISLKEEKLLIKEINDLKAQRKQLRSTVRTKAEISEAFNQKEHIHERHKTLKEDSDALFTNLKSLEENTRKIKKSLEGERIVLRKLNEEYRVANERRQKAYGDWFRLKNEPSKKNKYFFMYKNDQKMAKEHFAFGNMHQLQLYCNNQVERFMEIWNNDNDFRRQYVEANKVNILERSMAHDGRRLGPDEDPPVIRSRRPNNPSSSLSRSSPNVPTATSVPAPAPVVVSVKEESFPVLSSPDISKLAKLKASGTSAQNGKITVTVSERDIKEAEKEKARLMEEDLERAKKAEELAQIEEKLRQERAAAEKEQLRLEQKAKAKEAEERKMRKAEKAQERAKFKARKEAEMKEKKQAKKDKKKGQADRSVNCDGNAATVAIGDTDSNASDNSRDVEVPQPTAPKRVSRPAAAIKQLNRLQPMPAPLRNRGKRKMRQYILIAAAVLSVLALFVAGNYVPRLKSLHS